MSLAELRQLAADQAAARVAAKAFAAQVRETFGDRVGWIRLYGSLARGDWMGPDESDVDIAVVLQGRTDADIASVADLATRQMLLGGFVISPMLFSPAEFDALHQRELRLPQEILEQGIVL
jgi:predicted nucleotidyltransferase